VPDDDATLCAAAGNECGTFETIDNCGEMRTVDCGTCSGYLQCNTNQCGCSAPPEVTLQSCIYNGGPKINLQSPTTQVALAYSATSTPPSSCTSSNSVLWPVMGNGINLSWPGPNQCGSYRICSWDGACTSDYSPGATFHICVDSIGQPTCTF
jgi:hypothetical protein